MKATLIFLAGLTGTLQVLAGELPAGTVVRVEGKGIEAGWFTGTTTLSSEGCTMVKLDHATRDKYTMLSLMGVQRLQKQVSGQWQDAPLAGLLAREPKPCLVEGSD